MTGLGAPESVVIAAAVAAVATWLAARAAAAGSKRTADAQRRADDRTAARAESVDMRRVDAEALDRARLIFESIIEMLNAEIRRLNELVERLDQRSAVDRAEIARLLGIIDVLRADVDRLNAEVRRLSASRQKDRS